MEKQVQIGGVQEECPKKKFFREIYPWSEQDRDNYSNVSLPEKKSQILTPQNHKELKELGVTPVSLDWNPEFSLKCPCSPYSAYTAITGPRQL